MGRMGDTAIWNVAGRPSHVNPMEANMIDKFGKAGQQFTQRIGSGTINPNTGLPEYLPRWLTPPKKAKKWWNKNIKGTAKKVSNWWEDRGIPGKTLLDELGVGLQMASPLVSYFNPLAGVGTLGVGSVAACSSRIGKGDYLDCIKAGGPLSTYAREQGMPTDSPLIFDPNNPNANFNIPNLEGTIVTDTGQAINPVFDVVKILPVVSLCKSLKLICR